MHEIFITDDENNESANDDDDKDEADNEGAKTTPNSRV